MMITKEDLIHANDVYWELVNRARELLVKENPGNTGIDVEEIHVDPEEDYVFVSWSSWEPDRDSSLFIRPDVRRSRSTSYRINKFLSMINKKEKADQNDLIPVDLKGVRDGRKGH
jgi:hypothetical protein